MQLYGHSLVLTRRLASQVLHVLGNHLRHSPSWGVSVPMHRSCDAQHCSGQWCGHAHAAVHNPAGRLCHHQAIHPPLGCLVRLHIPLTHVSPTCQCKFMHVFLLLNTVPHTLQRDIYAVSGVHLSLVSLRGHFVL